VRRKQQTVPFVFLHMSRTAQLMCEEWLSRTSSARFSGEGWVYETKCFTKVTKVSSVCHPDFFPTPMQPVGPSRTKRSLNNFLGKMNIGGRAFPKTS
jgi:hypothetical protein